MMYYTKKTIDSKAVAQEARRLRQELGISIDAMAKAVGWTWSTLAMHEHNERKWSEEDLKQWNKGYEKLQFLYSVNKGGAQARSAGRPRGEEESTPESITTTS